MHRRQCRHVWYQNRFDHRAGVRLPDQVIEVEREHRNSHAWIGDKEACQGVTLDSPIASDERVRLMPS